MESGTWNVERGTWNVRPFAIRLCTFALLVCVLVPAAWGATVYVALSGSDGTPCAQVTQGSPRRTINGGIACLAGGGTLEIAAGEYPEILVAGTGTQDNARKVQPNTVALPGGTSSSPTTLKAQAGAAVWLRPTVTYPGGGGVITTTAGAEHLRFEGLNLDGLDTHSQTLYLKGNYLSYSHAEIVRGKGQCIASQTDSDHITFSHLHVHHCGMTAPPSQSPQPHAIYVCGTHKTIEYSHIHHAPNRGIQLSCEQGGIRNGIIRFNRISDVNIGIQLQGNDNQTHDNVIIAPGVGIWLGGGSGGLVRNNTIYQWRQVVDDTYGILAASSSGPELRDNIVYKQRVISSSSYNRYIHTTGSTPKTSGNMFDVAPAGGIRPQFVEPDEAKVFVDAPGGNFTLAPGSPAIGVGYQGGNLGASPPETVPPEPPVVLPPGAFLEYQLNDGTWVAVQELTQMPSQVCFRVRGLGATDAMVCSSGMVPR